jgi:glycosyltransferase involved in cell wall biosynthesis
MLYKEPLKLANKFFRNRQYAESIVFYEAAINLEPKLSSIYKFNLDFSNRRLQNLESDGHSQVVDLMPIRDLLQLPKKNQWKSLGGDPFYLLDQDLINKLTTQWCLIQFKIISELEKNNAKLYIDYGGDFNEDDSISIAYESEILISRIVSFKKPVKSLRFDPLEQIGFFEIQLLSISEISTEAAKSIMVSKLISTSEFGESSVEYLNNVTAECKADNVRLMDGLFNRYIESYKPDRDLLYQKWINDFEKPSMPSAEMISDVLKKMHEKPLISVVMPVFNPPEKYLRACLNSVINQTYPHWELCIADDNSTKPYVRRVLKEYEKLDKRIRVEYRSTNGNISLASNSALALTTGDFVALVDHDDMLSTNALYYVASAINQLPAVQIIYSDEDKVDEQGGRFDPHFKSDWNPDLFYSQNYVSHLGVYKRDLLQKINGFRVNFEGSQDQDLLLRCLPHTDYKNIHHIPKILYHWRALKGSTALGASEKSYTTQAGIRALQDYFKAIERPDVMVVQGQIPNTYRLHWPVPSPQPMVSLIIPTRDKKDVTELAVMSILNKTSYRNYEIIIIDNGSVELETLTWFNEIQKNERIRVLRYEKTFNFSAINNFGVQFAKGSIIGLVNNDVEVISPEWLTEMVSHAIRPEIGCVGAKLYYGNNTIQHAGVILGIGGVAGHSHKYFNRADYGYFSRLCLVQSLSAVTAACLIVRKEIYIEVGGLDEKNLTVAFNDVDFCIRVIERGYRNLWTPFAELYHHESVSRGVENSPEKVFRFNSEVSYMKDKWAKRLSNDPFYNPNLTTQNETFEIGVGESAIADITVGIAVITYKRPLSLKCCLESIFSHPTGNAEVVVFDDCSLDDSVKIAGNYAKYVSSQKNTGVIGNKNRAIYYFTEISKKDVIILIEDDVIIKSGNWLELWVLAAIKYGHMNFSAPWFENESLRDFYISGGGTLENPAVYKIVTGQCTSFLTSKIKENVGYLNPLFKGFGFGHVEWTNRFIANNLGGYSKEKVNYYYCISGGIEAIETASFKNDAEINSNEKVYEKLNSEDVFNFVEFPWTDDSSKDDFLKSF